MSPATAPAVPMLDLPSEVDRLWPQLQEQLGAVLRSGHFILGAQGRAFEAAAAEYLGLRHAIGVNSGTDALIIALRALGVGPGDEVITTPFTFFASAEAISLVGATPVLVDIEPDTLNIDPPQVEAAITSRTRALMPVHLFGHPADMDPLLAIARKHGLRVLEDTAQAMGARYKGRLVGTFGDIAAFSFFPTKNLGAYGDAGLIATDRADLDQAARMLHVHGSKERYHHELIGYNSRLDELQAAVLNIKLPLLDAYNRGRREVAAKYSAAFSGLPGVTVPAVRDDVEHAFHQYTLRIAGGRRDAVKDAMARQNVASMIYYPIPVHRLAAYAEMDFPPMPEADRAAAEVLSLPIWPGMPEAMQQRVIEVLAGAVR